ncbi:metastasis-associated protein MTA3 isoform X2 [Contarinia nasturtii]|uniref:metastasis-associated protein MTA3 isoform X2 n=1 Tax=Contarinia nasturtii TaxID=265458 RepID=UPI0012D3CD10|nr:metastasis-associated protein MTA3 isoform X2 [Contarinia nasturtii]
MTSNMYRVGDYVYFETSSTAPFQIRRIEELNKTSSGNVEAKVMCFYRRRDLPNPLVQLADKHQMASTEDSPIANKLKRIWFKTPIGEEQATQAVLDPVVASLEEERNSPSGGSGGNGSEKEPLTTKQRHQMKHRELFLSRQVETLPATHIRGKCSVTLLNETESILSYLNKDDSFFYCLVFDPTQKTLLADKGEIRVGSRYQTDVTPLLREGDSDNRNLDDLESLIWTPNHTLSDRKIDQFLVVSRSIGTFARALDCSSSVKQPSLHMSAAAASRDITLFHAMDTLHKHNYSIESSMCSFVPSSGPVLCRDEMEEWSASEANLFEEALDKYGKDFTDIRQDFLPWKTLKNIVEYYYMWKTTDRYVQQKRLKAVEAESKLKQVYIPNYTKPNSALLNSSSITATTKGGLSILNGSANGNSNNDVIAYNCGKPCESCSTAQSAQWYAWGPSHLSCRLCQSCWNYWKKYGGLKIASRLTDNDVDKKKLLTTNAANTANVNANANANVNANDVDGIVAAANANDLSNRLSHKCSIANCDKEFKLKAHLARHYAQAHGIAFRSGSPRPIMKTRTAFYLHTTGVTKLSRRLCRHIIRSKKAARQPSYAINLQAVKLEYANAIADKSFNDVRKLLIYSKKNRGSVTKIANRLGNPEPCESDWLKLTPKDKMPQPDKVAFPKPPKAADGSLIYERIPNKGEAESSKNSMDATSPVSLKRRHQGDDVNGVAADNNTSTVAPPAKRPNKDPMPSHRPTPEQYAAMISAAVAAGQPLPKHHMNGKPKIAQMSRTGSGRKQVISLQDAPDDVYFRATEGSKRTRKILTVTELRRSARKPYRQLNSSCYVALSKTLTVQLASLPAQLQIQPVPQATTPTAPSTKAAGTGSGPASNNTPSLNSPTNAEAPEAATAATASTSVSASSATETSPQSPPATVVATSSTATSSASPDATQNETNEANTTASAENDTNDSSTSGAGETQSVVILD